MSLCEPSETFSGSSNRCLPRALEHRHQRRSAPTNLGSLHRKVDWCPPESHRRVAGNRRRPRDPGVRMRRPRCCPVRISPMRMRRDLESRGRAQPTDPFACFSGARAPTKSAHSELGAGLQGAHDCAALLSRRPRRRSVVCCLSFSRSAACRCAAQAAAQVGTCPARTSGR